MIITMAVGSEFSVIVSIFCRAEMVWISRRVFQWDDIYTAFLYVFVTPSGFFSQIEFVLVGVSLGVAVGYPTFGTVGEYFGWESIFYFSALMGTIWYVLWLMVVFDSPETHPTITMEEKKYIQDRMGSNISNEKVHA